MKYFPSVDYAILKELPRDVIKRQPTLELAGRIIDGSNPQTPAANYFEGDDLFTPFERRRGIPLGNQTSQFFANIYLNPPDHFVKRKLKPDSYVRYVDDFLLFGDGKKALNEMRTAIEEFLDRFRLRIHPGKSRVYRAVDGQHFLAGEFFQTGRGWKPGTYRASGVDSNCFMGSTWRVS